MKHKPVVAGMAACQLMLSAQLIGVSPAHADQTVGQRIEKPLGEAGPGVVKSWVQVYSPLPAAAGPHPPGCDYVDYLRYRLADGPQQSGDADAVVTAMPGMFSGPEQFDSLAPEVLRRGHDRSRAVEFWGMQRRSPCYYDRTGLDAAIAAKDYRVAVDYYFNHKAVDGRTFPGWPSSNDTEALKSDDMDQQNRDWYTAIAEAIPDPQQRAKKVYCAGHSQGGENLSYFAATEFGSADHPAPGYAQCAGFVVLDTALTIDQADSKQSRPQDNPGTQPATAGRSFFQGILPDNVVPDAMTLFSIAGIAAYFEPDEESQLLRMLPHSPNMELILRGLLAADHLQLITNDPDVRSFRYTNTAMLGALLDNNSMPLTPADISFGSFGGGPVREKYLWVPEELADIPGTDITLPLIGWPLKKSLLGFDKVAPADPKALYTWNNYDQPAAPDNTGRVYSTPQTEHTDIHSLARQLFEGPTVFFDAFFPGTPRKDTTPVPYPNGPFEKRAVYIYGTNGTVNDTLQLLTPIVQILNPGSHPLRPPDAATGIGYTHLDVLTAAPRQNDGNPSATTIAITDFITR
ncbi:hypothetical protein [Nocardia arthritidis]|uniref:Alpha/beta hydrolase n=1 Tax=Nocardia arthritidis TaxID=228602 RepID=A0A6G9Y942_9NOCA|nr:hypothetical protein [Nocardia arthritidis]QIS09785.1 hypothetical protein F5544_09425 [Nocardia arthritidis]